MIENELGACEVDGKLPLLGKVQVCKMLQKLDEVLVCMIFHGM